MVFRKYGPPTAALLLISARLAAASCATDDPDGTRVLAARAQVQSDCTCDQSDPPAVSHGQYVSCAANVANQRAALDPSDPDFLPRTCKGAVRRCAARSVCGKRDVVTCCITNANGQTKCKRKEPTSCAAKNGTASACTSCCDACPSPGSGPSCPAPCGGYGLACCAGGTCNAPQLRCVDGRCVECGSIGGRCCPAPHSPCFTPSNICCNGFCLPSQGPGSCPTTTTTLP